MRRGLLILLLSLLLPVLVLVRLLETHLLAVEKTPERAVPAETDQEAHPKEHDKVDEHTNKEHKESDHKAKEEHLDPIAHVMDSHDTWDIFERMNVVIHLPSIQIGDWIIYISKFKILILIAAILIAAIYIPLANEAQSGEPPRGVFANAFEGLLTFIRDEVAKPNLGGGSHPASHEEEHHDAHGGHDPHDHHHAPRLKPGEHPADKYVPYLWTLFLFILFCNLLGMFPFSGSPTANIFVTGALAIITYFTIHIAAIAKMGFLPYLKSLWPPLDIPVPVAGFIIKLMICVIELMGSVIKCGVLAVRLYANMFAGHMVLATILMFIVMAGNAGPLLWGTVTVGSVMGVVALSLLELFVAFLQAYIFTFLTALFMGMAINPEH